MLDIVAVRPLGGMTPDLTAETLHVRTVVDDVVLVVMCQKQMGDGDVVALDRLQDRLERPA